MLDEGQATSNTGPARGLRPGRRARLAAAWVAAALTFLLVAALAGLPIYVFPHTDRPTKADAVIVLGPSSRQRIAAGTRLVDAGYAPRLFISMPADKARLSPCRQPNAGCFIPDPSTTRGEALFALEQARAHGWSKVVVVTGDSHITRARFIFGRCGGVNPVMIGISERRTLFAWGYQYVYQTAGFAKALIVGCAHPAPEDG
ncbi:YdcF family protein [Gryllotalpicola daejeonensis]|uniref:YdcF family protein n=1 Tax=Gryllotalpicola daejeonensis TaxID=993087 RepID=A0ABP7ZK56_9MICO